MSPLRPSVVFESQQNDLKHEVGATAMHSSYDISDTTAGSLVCHCLGDPH